LPQTTLKRYFALPETMFLLQPLRPWFRNLGKRLIQTPKVCLNDSGPLASLLGAAENFIKAWSRLASGEANGQKSIGLAD
jgi:predicted AAA+ superfamily ATPase